MSLRARLALVSVLLVVAVSSPVAAAVPPGFELDGDRFDPVLTLSGPVLPLNVVGAEGGEWYLRSLVEKRTRMVVHQLHVNELYSDTFRHAYEAAYDADANLHPLIVFSRARIGESGFGLQPKSLYQEVVGVEISDEEMRAYAKAGAAFKIKGRGGASFIIEIPAEAVRKQLAALSPYAAAPYPVDPRVLPPLPLGAAYSERAGFAEREPAEGGVRITRLKPGSVAEKAGLEKGDWVLAMDSRALKSAADMDAALARLAFGDVVSATVRRKAETLRLSLQF